MTGRLDPARYADLEARVTALVRQVARAFPAEQIDLLLELAEHNEPGVAVEMLSAMLVEAASPVTTQVRDEFEALATVMRLDSGVWRELRLSHPPE